MNSLVIEKKGFKEQVGLVKEVINSIKINLNSLMYFAFYILCFFTLYDYLNINMMVDHNKVDIKNPYSTGSLSIMAFEAFKTIIFLYLLTIMSQAKIFINKENNGKNILKSIFNIKLYLNMLFLGFILLFTALLFGHIGLPADFIYSLVENQNNPQEFDNVLKEYSNTLTSLDFFLIIFSVLGFLVCFGFFLFSSYFSYLNIKTHNLGVIKGNLKTYWGLLKNILYWIIPTLLYFLGIGFLINNVAPNGIENTLIDNLFRNILLSIYLAVGGLYINTLKLSIFPIIEDFNPNKDEKERIQKKYKRKRRK